MLYFIFDTETSGLPDMNDRLKENPYEVIQLSGFLVTEDFKIKQVVNLYCNISKPISPGAVAVHGIDNKKLLKLSKGLTLEDHLVNPKYSWLTNPKDIAFIAYNVDFDKRMVNDSLKNNGYKGIDFGREVNILPKRGSKGVYNMCLCKASKAAFGYRRLRKLIDVVSEKLPYSETQINKGLDRICKGFGVSREQASYHDALFDSQALLLLLWKYIMYFRK